MIGYIFFIAVLVTIIISWYIMYQIGMGNGIRSGIAIGKRQILKEDIARLDSIQTINDGYHDTLISYLPQLKEV